MVVSVYSVVKLTVVKQIIDFKAYRLHRCVHNKPQLISRVTDQAVNSKAAAKLAVWMRFYENFIGLTDVKNAQDRVLGAEKKFLENQELRRERQLQIQQVQMKLKEIQLELDKTLRGEDRYLQLVTQEHSVLGEERKLSAEFKIYERAERDYFSSLSNAVRESHERERAYAEKTKYWSIIGSVCGAIIGIVGTTINNWVRLREMRDIVHESSSFSSVTPQLNALYEQVTHAVTSQQNQMTSFLAHIGQLSSRGSEESRIVPIASDNVLTTIKERDDVLREELSEIKALLVAHRLVGSDSNEDRGSDDRIGGGGAVVYLGRDIERLVKDAQHNLEWKMKINSLATVTMIYGAFALSVPILFRIFGS